MKESSLKESILKRGMLWNHKPSLAYPGALAVGMVWLLIMRLAGLTLTTTSYLTSISFGIAASTLVFVFLLQTSEGSWKRRIRLELFALGATLTLILILVGVTYLITPLGMFNRTEGKTAIGIVYVEDNPLEMLPFTLALCGFSHVAVRIFANLYEHWQRLRQKRLIWEITHIQVRFVIISAGLLLLLLVINLLISMPGMEPEPPIQIVRTLTNFVLLAGIVGIISGIGILIILIPAAFLSYFTARRITSRLNDLVQATEAIRAGQHGARVNIEGEDEIAQLQTDFNMMAETLESVLEDLQNERDAVADLLQSRRGLFASVSHELRTPISTLRSYVETLHRYVKSTPGLHTDLEVMEREVLRLQRLIDDIFILTRTDIDRLQYAIKLEEIDSIVQRTVEAAKLQAWQAKKIDVVLDSQPQIPLVRVDATRLEQVMHNLLRNAIRHTLPGGFIAVSITCDASWVRIDVKDTGEGIAALDLLHIWEPFYRSQVSQASDVDGAGLGLAIVKEMTEAMDGTVGVESIPGEGSCFTVRLPRADNG